MRKKKAIITDSITAKEYNSMIMSIAPKAEELPGNFTPIEEIMTLPPAYSEHREFIRTDNQPLLDILSRLCDACHDLDGKTEPWASIRKEIERLK